MKLSLENITGFLGVGTLEILGIFFILDGTSGFLLFVESYSNTSTWAILVTVPLLVVAYVFGLLTSIGTELLSNRVFPNKITPDLFASVVSIDNELLSAKFVEYERQSQLLYGCAFAFLLLGIGSLAEVPMMGRFGFVGYVGLVGGLCVAMLCPIIAKQLQNQFYYRLTSLIIKTSLNKTDTTDVKIRAAD